MISLYYYEELTMREIGEVLGITESRVSQIHSKAVFRHPREAAIVFGALAWSFGSLVMDREKAPEVLDEDAEASEDARLDETI